MTDYQSKRVADFGGVADYNFMHRPGFEGAAEVMQATSKLDENSIQGDALFVNAAAGNFTVKEDSKVFSVGFKNFPMDNFGVTDPDLKALAQQPVIPEIILLSEIREEETVPWYGGVFKDFANENDLSSVGMGEQKGAWLFAMDKEARLAESGLKENDVILSLNGEAVKNVNHFFIIQKLIPYIHVWNARVWRNQKEIEIKLDFEF